MQKTKTISYRSHCKLGPVPCIFLQGLFLADLGFHLGEKVKVDYQAGKIVITTLDEEAT